MIKETKETKTKKNPDYSKTIVNQTNADEVKVALHVYYELQLDAEKLRGMLEKMPEFKEWVAASTKVDWQKSKVQDVIDNYGSYQDVENGIYGLKYSRQSKDYHAEPFLEKYSKYAPAVIEQTINVKALEGLVKGGLLAEVELKQAGVITETPTFAYYIR